LVNEYDVWEGRVQNFDYSTIRAVVGVPLLAGNRVMGVLSVAHDAASDQTFAPEAIDLLEQFARLAVIAIDNARLFKQTKDDMLILRRLNAELEEAMTQVKLLGGLLPICSNCKKIRDDDGYWQDVAVYIRDHSEAEFTHGICPECIKKLYPDLAEDVRPK
jgi:transcriptional regulator with GAF, ATPase, and Fis domain